MKKFVKIYDHDRMFVEILALFTVSENKEFYHNATSPNGWTHCAKPLLNQDKNQVGWLIEGVQNYEFIRNHKEAWLEISQDEFIKLDINEGPDTKEADEYTFLKNKGVKITISLKSNKSFRLEKTDCLFCGLDHDINSKREYVSYNIYMKHISITRICPHCGAKQVFKYPYPKDMNFNILKNLAMFYIDNGWLDLYGPPVNTIYEGQFVDDQVILRCTEISASI